MSRHFAHPAAALADVAHALLRAARQHGASDASVMVSENEGLSVDLRQGRVRSRTRHASQSLALTLYIGQRRASAQSADFSASGLAELAAAAAAIARSTGEDPHAGLADPAQLCQTPRALDLYQPWQIGLDEAIAIAHRIEAGVQGVDPAVQSNGVSVGSSHHQFVLATSAGFCQGYAQSSHSLSAVALAERGASRQLDWCSDAARQASQLAEPAALGQRAAQAALALLDARPLPSGNARVLFDPRSASALVGHLVGAASGRALYTRSSFLCDTLGQACMAAHLSLWDDPFIPGAMGSAPFDSDGIEAQAQALVADGVLRSYLLASYSARRLGLRATGHGDGPHNLRLTSHRTAATDDQAAMLRRLGTGLWVTSVSGDGVNLSTGDYSRAARGFWVQDGQIVHPVDQITLAGSLPQLYAGIEAVGADEQTHGHVRCGSVLVDALRIGGQ